MNRTSIKICAKSYLNGKSFRAFAVWLLPCIAVIVSSVLNSMLLRCERSDPRQTWLFVLGECVLTSFSILLCTALRQGREAWYVRTAEGRVSSKWQMLYWLRLKRTMRVLRVRVNVAVRKMCWYILFTIPAIILFGTEIYRAANGMDFRAASATACVCGMISMLTGIVFASILCEKYCMVFLLLSLNPEEKNATLIRKSFSLTDGKCLRLFAFRLSFLPWFLSCAVCIPVFYTVPYYRLSATCLKLSLLEQSNNK